MSHWDRKALLSLIEDAGKRLQTSELSAAQRQALRLLLGQYGDKAKSVNTGPMDVTAMQGELSRILHPSEGNQDKAT